MPQTSKATLNDIDLIKMFNPAAHSRLVSMHEEGKEIEMIQSSINDPGDDYVEFKVGNETICHIPGY